VIVLSFVVIAVPVKLRPNHAFVYSQLDFEGTCSHISFGEHSQITFLRTFGSRRPPTLIIRNLPLFLSDAARAWLEHLPPAQISNWDDLVKAFAGNF
jgi:hypothetical protein